MLSAISSGISQRYFSLESGNPADSDFVVFVVVVVVVVVVVMTVVIVQGTKRGAAAAEC